MVAKTSILELLDNKVIERIYAIQMRHSQRYII